MLVHQVHLMLCVGAPLTGTMGSGVEPEDGPARNLLATQLVEAGARLDSAASGACSPLTRLREPSTRR